MMHKAMFYEKLPEKRVRCYLCRHQCRIQDGKRGICRVRENRGGTLYSMFYGKPIALAVDPIEKKPLFHFLPGSTSFSVATLGCNFQCPFCQNWDISQYGRVKGIREAQGTVSPEEVVRLARENRCASISYTYSEPTIFFEYAYDIGVLARAAGMRNVFVTNGYMSPEAIERARDFLDAANVDLKAFREETYRRYMKAKLKGVLDSIILLKRAGVWVELTTLLVPRLNDDLGEINEMAQFVASAGKETPWHLSRFHPDYRYGDVGPTPARLLEQAYQAGKDAGLKYVYVGNLPGHQRESTWCSSCGIRLIQRVGFRIHDNRTGAGGVCQACGAPVEGVFQIPAAPA